MAIGSLLYELFLLCNFIKFSSSFNKIYVCSFDLLVLKEIITTMSGVEITTSLTDDQLQAQSGGDVLKQEVCL